MISDQPSYGSQKSDCQGSENESSTPRAAVRKTMKRRQIPTLAAVHISEGPPFNPDHPLGSLTSAERHQQIIKKLAEVLASVAMRRAAKHVQLADKGIPKYPLQKCCGIFGHENCSTADESE